MSCRQLLVTHIRLSFKVDPDPWTLLLTFSTSTGTVPEFCLYRLFFSLSFVSLLLCFLYRNDGCPLKNNLLLHQIYNVTKIWVVCGTFPFMGLGLERCMSLPLIGTYIWTSNGHSLIKCKRKRDSSCYNNLRCEYYIFRTVTAGGSGTFSTTSCSSRSWSRCTLFVSSRCILQLTLPFFSCNSVWKLKLFFGFAKVRKRW